MKQGKCVYPSAGNCKWLSKAILVLTAVVIASGVLFRQKNDGFGLSEIPAPTPLPMSESFDETPVTTEIHLAPAVWYALQTGVFEEYEGAQAAAQAFIRRGAAGYLWRDGRFRVLAAAYPSREDAQQVREQLLSEHDIACYLYTIEMPAAHLRLTGMQGQIEILEAAFSHIHDLACQLHGMSVAMDRRELSVGEAVKKLDAYHTQMSIVSQRLKERFQLPLHPTIQAVMECLEGFEAFCADFLAEDSAVAAGIKLKYQTIDTLWKIQKVYATLNHT